MLPQTPVLSDEAQWSEAGVEQRKQATWAGSRVARLGLSSEGWNNRGLGWSEASAVVVTGRRGQ